MKLATYISAIDLLVHLPLRPLPAEQDPILHQSLDPVFNQVIIHIYGEEKTASLDRDDALNGLYRIPEFLGDTKAFVAILQETLDYAGQALATTKISPTNSSSSTFQEDDVSLTRKSNVTDAHDGWCNKFFSTSTPETPTKPGRADAWHPAANTIDIDILLGSSSSAVLPVDGTDSASNDDAWFI